MTGAQATVVDWSDGERLQEELPYDPSARSKKSWMEVRVGVMSSVIEGRQGDERLKERRYEGKVGLWQSQVPMWMGMALQEEPCVGMEKGIGGERHMEPSRERLMTTLGQE